MADEKQIRYFLKLYETGSMHKAAETLYISQQGLSKSIQELEKDLRVKLFYRQASGVVPTEAGSYFYEEAKKMLNTYMQVRKNTRLKDGGRVQLRMPFSLGVFETVYPLYRAFNKENDTIRLSWEIVSDKTCEDRVISNLSMFAVKLGLSSQNLFDQQILFTDQLAVISYEKTDNKTISLNDLDHQKVVVHTSMQGVNEAFAQACSARKISVQTIAMSDDLGFILYLLKKEKARVIVPYRYGKAVCEGRIQILEDLTIPAVWIKKKGWVEKGIYKEVSDELLQRLTANDK